MTDREIIIAKIKKCLALSKSCNENEAAAALRQAQALMRKYMVSDGEVLAADVSEAQARAGAKAKPVSWETQLADLVAKFFRCRLVFSAGPKSGAWTFIAEGASAEIAQYAFCVLLRQAKAARKHHIATVLKRCKAATRSRRADLFCDGWVVAVRYPIRELFGDDVP